MFYLTPQERKFIAVVLVVFIMGAFVQLSFKRDIAPLRWARHVREFKININTAPALELQMLPGVGAKVAERIIDYRRENHGFKSIHELQDIDGITQKRFDKIKGLVKL